MTNLSSSPLKNVGQLATALRHSLSEDLLFYHLFGTGDYENHALWSASIEESICQTTWGKGDVAFRCLDCESDSNCVIC
jgi:hypothetical protein